MTKPYSQASSYPGIVVAGVATLRAVESHLLTDGGRARVGFSPAYTTFQWPSARTEDDNGTSIIKPNDIAPGNPGRWVIESVLTPGMPGANVIAQWYVNTTTGDDNNDGIDPSTPIATLDEFFRRLGTQPIDNTTIVVDVAGNDTSSVGPFNPVIVNGGYLKIRGTRTVQPAASPPYIIQARVTWVGAPTYSEGKYKLQDAALANPDLSALGASGAWFGVPASNPNALSPIGNDMGGGEFRGTWASSGSSIVEPAVGSQVTLHSVNTVSNGVTINPQCGPLSIFEFEDIGLSSIKVVGSGGGAMHFTGCLLNTVSLGAGLGEVTFTSCHVNFFVNQGQSIANFAGCIVYNQCDTVAGGTSRFRFAHSIVQGASITAGNDDGPGKVLLEGATTKIAVCNYNGTGRALYVGPGSFVYADAECWGVNALASALGGLVASGGLVVASSAAKLPYMLDSTTPPTNAWSIGGVLVSQSNVPYAGNGNVLVSGTQTGLAVKGTYTFEGIAGLQQTTSAAYDEKGAIIFDPSTFTSVGRTIRFRAVVEVSVAGQDCTVQLYNITDGASVVELTASDTFPGIVQAVLTVPASIPNGERMYGVRIKRTGGGLTDPVTCKLAFVEVAYA